MLRNKRKVNVYFWFHMGPKQWSPGGAVLVWSIQQPSHPQGIFLLVMLVIIPRNIHTT